MKKIYRTKEIIDLYEVKNNWPADWRPGVITTEEGFALYHGPWWMALLNKFLWRMIPAKKTKNKRG